MLDSGISRLLGQIYSDSGDSEGLARLLDEVIVRTGSGLGFLATADLSAERVLRTQLFGQVESRTVDAIAQFEAGEVRTDPTFAYLSAGPGRRYFDTSSAMTPEEHATHPHLLWNRHHMRASHWIVGHSQVVAGMGFGMSLHAGDPTSPHGAEQKQLFALLFEHFDRAARLSARPPDLHNPGQAIVLIDVTGQVSAMSDAAGAIVGGHDGLRMQGRQLMVDHAPAQRRLQRLIASALGAIATGAIGGALAIERPSGLRPFALIVDPLPAQAGLARFMSGALVRIVDPEMGAPVGAADRWRTLWGLTPAEARLAETMTANGCDLRDAGDRLGVTYATVRTQLAQIFAKTGTNGQPELMRLLARISG
jgi:DNA-binding CsgD family transcriptional regulator